jgi:NADH-quinone oxidoreductase subunit M
MILGAIYMLRMVARIGFGPLVLPEGSVATDANRRELGALVPLALAVLALGIGPRPVLDLVQKGRPGTRRPRAGKATEARRGAGEVM